MEKDFQVTIYTPLGKYLVTRAEYLSVKTTVSVIGVLPNHAPLISTLEVCKLTIKIAGKTYTYAISGGVIDIKKNTDVVLLLNSIERQDEIDILRAKAAKDRAEELLKHSVEIDVKRAKASLARALNRISVYENKL